MRAIVSRKLLVVALVALACPWVGPGLPPDGGRVRAQGAPPARPWPPGVQAVAPDSPPRSPDEERATFFMAPGYRVELVAAEPLVQDPIAIDWDSQGRLWVVEIPGFMPDITASTEHAPVGRIVVLEDRDGDGRMDRRTVFADGLVLARSVKVVEGGVLVSEPPSLWFMRDADGDLRMDGRTLVSDQFGRRDIDVQNNANGFDWGLDNRLRTAGQSRLHLQWKAGTFVPSASPVRGQWGATHDDVGRTYRNTNESALHVDLIAGEYFTRNPNLLRTRGSYERLATNDNGLNVVWPVRPNPGINRGYQAGIRRPDGTLERYTAVCSPVVYRGDRLPADLRGNVFVADPAANVVSRLILEDGDGGALGAGKAYPDAEFLASTDERFRPVFLANAPDGTLTIVDLYRGVVEHRISLTQYLRAYVEQHGLLEPRGRGRIWRVVHDTTRRDTTRMPTGTTDLVAMLAHPNGWRRDTAQRLLVQRADPGAMPALERLVGEGAEPRTRLHAMWTLDGLEALSPDMMRRALADPSPWVQAAALRAAERWAEDPDVDVAALLEARLRAADARVRLQAVASIGALPPGMRKFRLAAEALRHSAGDPFIVDAVLSGVRAGEAQVLALLLPTGDRTTGEALPEAAREAITMLAATVFQVGQDEAARAWLDRAADERLPSWQRDALMHGAEVGLLGAPVPGQLPSLVNAALTCPTCPGGRLSTGGAYAFTDPAIFARTATAGRTLRLTRAPDAFVRLATADTRLSKQAAVVLTRLSWPGKPGDAAAPPALTAAEQARFDTGRQVYESTCQACHQPDGRGAPGRAASLVGSAIALGDPGVTVRVLLHGKEGQTGLMPPIGSTLSDEQLASVLTFVRREWGHGSTAVEPALVARLRESTRQRTRPWTDGELAKVR